MSAPMKMAEPSAFARLVAILTSRAIADTIDTTSRGSAAYKAELANLKICDSLSDLVRVSVSSALMHCSDTGASRVAIMLRHAGSQHIDAIYRAYDLMREYWLDHAFGSVLVKAWAGAGGEVEPLRIHGINQLVVKNADAHGLYMGRWHCGTSHCIAGWYSVLSGQRCVEALFSCRLAAWLIFAVNNPGETMPYMGSDEAEGQHELQRLAGLNRLAPQPDDQNRAFERQTISECPVLLPEAVDDHAAQNDISQRLTDQDSSA